MNIPLGVIALTQTHSYILMEGGSGRKARERQGRVRKAKKGNPPSLVGKLTLLH